jgi:hypothetical protein
MKKIITYLAVSLMLTTILVGCYYDQEEVFIGLPKNVSLKNDVQPIFDLNCNMSGCHDQNGTHDPSLVSKNVYDALVLGKYVNTLEPEKSKIYLQLVNGVMPPSGPLGVNEQKIILAWITEGSKNN